MRGEVWGSRGLALACMGRLAEAELCVAAVQGSTRAVEANVLLLCIEAIKALKDDYTQLLAAANAGDLTKINELQTTLTADANTFDNLCPVDLRK